MVNDGYIDYGEPLTAEEIRNNNPTINTLIHAKMEQHLRNRTKGKMFDAVLNFLLLFGGVMVVVLLL